MVAYKGLAGEHIVQALQEDLVAGRDPRTGDYMDPDYLDWLKRTSPDLFNDKKPTDKEWKPKPGTDPLTGLPLAKTRPELESDDYRMRREQMNRGSGKPIDPTDVYEPPDPALDPLTGIPLAKTRPDLESDDYRMRREQMNRGKKKKIDPTDVYEPPDPGLDPLTGMPLAKGREPNKEDAPYRPKPPGGPPWPGYPNPMPPGTPTKLVQGLPPVIGERDAIIQRADALRKAGKINEALDLYRHAATLPTPQV